MNQSIEDLIGIGPKSGQWLREAGIATRDDLARVGVIEAYRRVRKAGHAVNLNLLWALQGGLMDIHWSMISPKQRETLKAQLKQAEV